MVSEVYVGGELSSEAWCTLQGVVLKAMFWIHTVLDVIVLAWKRDLRVSEDYLCSDTVAPVYMRRLWIPFNANILRC